MGIFYDVTVFFLNGLNKRMYVNQCHNDGYGIFFFLLLNNFRHLYRYSNASFYAQASFFSDRFFLSQLLLGWFHRLLLVKQYIVFDPQNSEEKKKHQPHLAKPCNLNVRSIAPWFFDWCILWQSFDFRLCE